jgi:hypothetical protein
MRPALNVMGIRENIEARTRERLGVQGGQTSTLGPEAPGTWGVSCWPLAAAAGRSEVLRHAQWIPVAWVSFSADRLRGVFRRWPCIIIDLITVQSPQQPSVACGAEGCVTCMMSGFAMMGEDYSLRK